MKTHFHADSAVLRDKPGPLHSHLLDFATALRDRGYCKDAIAQRVRLAFALDRWMRQRGTAIKEFNEQCIQKFLCYRRKRYSQQSGDFATLHSLLEYFRDIKVIPYPAKHHEDSPIEQLQARFARYLLEQRGLRPATVKQSLLHTRRFLSQRFGDGPLVWRELSLQDISRFVLRQAKVISPIAARRTTIALRSLLRFLQQGGDIVCNLAGSVPAIANWSYARLPQPLSPQEVELLLKTCKHKSAVGQRNRAILLLLARLGLRAGEVGNMTLDDIDWQAGELTIRGKGGRADRLPLPIDVGHSLAQYLWHVRPKCASRRVFLRLRAPHQGFADSTTVSMIVRRALKRAGLNPNTKGAHVLRHSLAMRMLHRGISLMEIGKVLRHQSPDTTLIYAKIDITRLRTLAQPWPGGEA